MKLFGINFDKNKIKDEHKDYVLVKCSKCGVEEWQRERYCNLNDNLCRKHHEEKREEELKIKREKQEATYCKDGEHNYIAVARMEEEGDDVICSKCGKYLNLHL